MANTYKNNIASITSTGSDEAIYTCPADATAIINTIFVYNRSGGAATFSLKLTVGLVTLNDILVLRY